MVMGLKSCHSTFIKISTQAAPKIFPVGHRQRIRQLAQFNGIKSKDNKKNKPFQKASDFR